MYDNLLLIIFKKLKFKKLISLFFINNDIVIIMYLIKKHYLLLLLEKIEKGIELSNNGFKIKLDLCFTRISDVSKLGNVHWGRRFSLFSF